MSSSVKPAPAPTPSEERRDKVMRELKLALVDQQVLSQGAGCNPYESAQGRGHSERWERRRR